MRNLHVLDNRRDTQWAHPELAGTYEIMNASLGSDSQVYNLELTPEKRKELADSEAANFRTTYGFTDDSPLFKRAEYFTAPGCEEEPETSVEIVVYRPLKESKKKLPVILVVPGGGLKYAVVEEDPFNLSRADGLNCVIVRPRYRTAFQAQYPAALNDCHAAWNWVIANADMLHINVKKIVLNGGSSGSHLALSLAHRLKRYNQKPCGCVVEEAFTDHRPIYPTSSILTGWDAAAQWRASMIYLGFNNVSCFNGPEMYPMYATEEDCVGLCPTFIHAATEDEGASSCRAYADKLTVAGVYNELHCWGGASHIVLQTTLMSNPDSPYGRRYISLIESNIKDCWQYDLCREWINDLVKDD